MVIKFLSKSMSWPVTSVQAIKKNAMGESSYIFFHQLIMFFWHNKGKTWPLYLLCRIPSLFPVNTSANMGGVYTFADGNWHASSLLFQAVALTREVYAFEHLTPSDNSLLPSHWATCFFRAREIQRVCPYHQLARRLRLYLRLWPAHHPYSLPSDMTGLGSKLDTAHRWLTQLH